MAIALALVDDREQEAWREFRRATVALYFIGVAVIDRASRGYRSGATAGHFLTGELPPHLWVHKALKERCKSSHAVTPSAVFGIAMRVVVVVLCRFP